LPHFFVNFAPENLNVMRKLLLFETLAVSDSYANALNKTDVLESLLSVIGRMPSIHPLSTLWVSA